MDRRSRQNHRCRQTRAPSVRFDPLASGRGVYGDYHYVTRSPSKGDAQLLLDVAHHRVRQARFAEFREVLSDGALPKLAILLRARLAFVGKAQRLSP
jgi:hypothetical protein